VAGDVLAYVVDLDTLRGAVVEATKVAEDIYYVQDGPEGIAGTVFFVPRNTRIVAHMRRVRGGRYLPSPLYLVVKTSRLGMAVDPRDLADIGIVGEIVGEVNAARLSQAIRDAYKILVEKVKSGELQRVEIVPSLGVGVALTPGPLFKAPLRFTTNLFSAENVIVQEHVKRFVEIEKELLRERVMLERAKALRIGKIVGAIVLSLIVAMVLLLVWALMAPHGGHSAPAVPNIIQSIQHMVQPGATHATPPHIKPPPGMVHNATSTAVAGGGAG